MDGFDRCRGAAPTQRATSYLQYGYFVLVVYPELRPIGDAAGDRAFLGTIEKDRQRLAELNVLHGLDAAQQNALAALVADFTAKSEMFRSFQRIVALVREVPKLLGGHTMRRMATLRKALIQIRDGLSSPHPLVERDQLDAAISALADFDKLTPFATGRAAEEFVDRVTIEHPQGSDPTMDATCQIYWYLAERCGQSQKEAEIRVAKIGNAFFGWQIKYREKSEGQERWRGSVTVRQRIKRNCPPQP